MGYKNVLLFCFLVLSFIPQVALSAEDDETEPAQYIRYDHGVIGKPGDAAERMVLDVEENRELKPAGNIVHVEGTDEYIGKGISEISAKISKMEAKFAEIDRRLAVLEKKLKQTG